jgi:hypothetical protein
MIVNNQSAPRIKHITNIFTKYNDDYELEIAQIPNDKYYRSLFTKGSSINKIRFKIPMPKVDELQNIPGLSSKQFKKFKELDFDFIDIEVAANPRTFISNNKKDIVEVITIMEENLDDYEKCEIDGKIFGSNRHTFNLKDEFFSFNINVDPKKNQNNQSIYKFETELQNEYKEKLINILNDNREFLNKMK